MPEREREGEGGREGGRKGKREGGKERRREGGREGGGGGGKMWRVGEEREEWMAQKHMQQPKRKQVIMKRLM